MMDKSKTIDELSRIKDFITGKGEMMYATDEDITHFEEVIEAAQSYLLEDEIMKTNLEIYHDKDDQMWYVYDKTDDNH